MAGFDDVYVLVPTRSVAIVERFLARFAPQRKESADDYPIPRFSDSPTHVFSQAHDVVAYCADHPQEEHAIYWRCCHDHDPAHAMVFFTTDGALILGLSVRRDSQLWLSDLQRFAKSNAGCILFEQPPPDNVDEFLELVSKVDRLA